MSARLILAAALAALVALPAGANEMHRLRQGIAARNVGPVPLWTRNALPAQKGKMQRTGCAHGPTASGLSCAIIGFGPPPSFPKPPQPEIFSLFHAVPFGPNGATGLALDLPRLSARTHSAPRLFESQHSRPGHGR